MQAICGVELINNKSVKEEVVLLQMNDNAEIAKAGLARFRAYALAYVK